MTAGEQQTVVLMCLLWPTVLFIYVWIPLFRGFKVWDPRNHQGVITPRELLWVGTKAWDFRFKLKPISAVAAELKQVRHGIPPFHPLLR